MEDAMVEFTTNQWIIIALVLVLGWLLGLASRSGGRKWKQAYRDEREAHVAYRRDTEARIAGANERISELERHAPAIGAGTASAIGAAARGRRDDLSAIRGVDHDLAIRLNECGVHGFRDVARLSSADQAALEGRLGLEPGRITREAWPEQADMLARGHIKEHEDAFR
jgi:predicted flap endonuclease-1-like 5' DNA nuclease